MKFKSGDRPFMCFIIATVHVLQLNSAVESDLPCVDEGEVRLMGRQSRFEGRVEVCDNRTWKTVCDRMWREEEAKVVCRQLNYSEPSNATYVRRACAGQGYATQDTLKVEWKCSGQESKLLDCNRTQVTSPCDHRRDAGVYCSGQTPDNCKEDSLRLMGGPNNASGRVEVCRFGCWGTVCDEGWDRYSSIVACRELGFKTEKAIPTRGGYFSSIGSSRLIHISQTECEGDDTKLTNCSEFKLNNCTHSQDAGVICHGTSMCRDGDLQLVGGETEREGQVEICYNGVWGAVCANGWNETAASIVCNQLGYANSTGLPLEGIGLGNSLPLFNNIACSETNHSMTMLLQCIDWNDIGVYNCNESNTARVSCKQPNPDVTTASMLAKTSQAITTSTSDVSNPQSVAAVLGTVGGLLAVMAITAIGVASVMMFRKQKKIPFKKEIVTGSAMDNPAYDECQGTSTLNNLTINHDSEHEREFENPIYSEDDIDTGLNPASKKTNSQLQDTPHYERIYFESAEVTEATYESADNGIVQGAHLKINGPINNTSSANDGAIMMKGATSEGVYELLPNLDGVAAGDEDCYSPLDPTYSQLEPHLGVPKPGVEIPCPLNDNDYSHLKYNK